MNNVKFTPTLIKGLDNAIINNLPFALYMFPNDDKIHFIASSRILLEHENRCGGLERNSDWNGFAIDMFQSVGEAPIGISNDLSLKEVCHMDAAESRYPAAYNTPNGYNTPQAVYLAQLQRIISELRKDNATLRKVVLSRMISGIGRNIVEVAQEYFSKLPYTFRYLYFTQETGMWIGASPELLLEYDYSIDTVSTMSLAGTRSLKDKTNPWSEKNQHEHDVVTNYIVRKMQSIGLNPTVHPLVAKRFGEVEHLCNNITATAPNLNITELIHKLSPTPALSGFPQKEAMELISHIEAYPRLCYGGWVAVKDSNSVKAYVNLRCAHVLPDMAGSLYSIYAGGGIMPQSEFIDEWMETANKVSPLLEAFCGKKIAAQKPILSINEEFLCKTK